MVARIFWLRFSPLLKRDGCLRSKLALQPFLFGDLGFATEDRSFLREEIVGLHQRLTIHPAVIDGDWVGLGGKGNEEEMSDSLRVSVVDEPQPALSCLTDGKAGFVVEDEADC